METTRDPKYWYGGTLNVSYKYPNLTKTELKTKTKDQLQIMYNNYWEYGCNLEWEKEKDVEYHHYKNLKKFDKEIERNRKNERRIEEVFESKRG